MAVHIRDGCINEFFFIFSVTFAVIQLFQKKKLQENELHNVQENIRHLNKDTGPLIYDYYKVLWY